MNKNVPIIFVGLTVSMFVMFVGGNFVLDKVADRVIQRLQRDYSPSPYGPGFDPDKIDMNKVK
jgi:hypothetical protein